MTREQIDQKISFVLSEGRKNKCHFTCDFENSRSSYNHNNDEDLRRIRQDTKRVMAVRAELISERKTDGSEYKELCKEIRKSLQADYEEYRIIRLRGAAEKEMFKKRREEVTVEKIAASRTERRKWKADNGWIADETNI